MADRGAPLESARILEDEPGIVPHDVMATDDELAAPTHDKVAELAYSYWEARGGICGSPWEDWFRAEQELKRKREL